MSDLLLKRLFLDHIAQTSPEPIALQVERAEGIYIYNKEGKSFIDLISGISVNNVGHRHPHVQAAIQKQLDQYWHTMVYGEHVQEIQVKLAQKLSEKLPFNQASVFFVNSGSEAIEGAIKLAKRYTGRPNLAAAKKAYHGSTHGALSLMSESYYNAAFRPLLPGVTFLDFNNIHSLDLIDNQTAAVVIESVQGEAGYIPAEQDFLTQLEKKCKECGTLLILDEIQTGFGRTGKFFAFEHYSIKPDIVVMAKGMGGGMPIGAFAADKKQMLSLSDHPVLGHITTFGGHPVSCAASLATMEVIENEHLMGDIHKKESLFRNLIQHPDILAWSGKGLLLSIQLKDADKVKQVIARALEKGLLIDWFLFAPDRIRIAPPLTIREDEIIRVCEILNQALNA